MYADRPIPDLSAKPATHQRITVIGARNRLKTQTIIYSNLSGS
jgi:hypothetical protein